MKTKFGNQISPELLSSSPITVLSTPTLLGTVDLTKANPNYEPTGFIPEGFFALAINTGAGISGDLVVAVKCEVEGEMYEAPLLTVDSTDYDSNATKLIIPVPVPVSTKYSFYMSSASGDVLVNECYCLVQ